MRAWFQKLNETYGWKILFILFASQHVLKGFVMSLTLSSNDYLLKEFHLTGPHLQLYKAIISLPWALKPLVGILSDSVPIFGYRKAPYILIATVLGITAFAVVGSNANLQLYEVVTCLFFGNLHVSVSDLLTEAKYSEKIREDPSHGPDLVTYVWSGVTMGAFVAVSSSGLLISSYGPRLVYLICAVTSSFVLFPTLINCLEEKQMTAEEVSAHRGRMIKHEKVVIYLSVLVAGCVGAMAAAGLIITNVTTSFYVSLVVAFMVLSAFTIFLRPDIGSVNAFYFIQTSCALGIDGATFYFFTDSAAVFPGGPNFSIFFYTTVVGLVAAMFNLIGLWSYANFAKAWKYQSLFFSANIFLSVINLCSVMLYSRLNLQLGIPDKVFVICGSVLQSLISTWMWMPGVVLMAQLCPRGMEASMYALLAGCHNIGSSVAQSFGAFMLENLHVNPTGKEGDPEQFGNLWIAALVSAIFPMFSLALIPYCVPDALQTDTILSENVSSATAGSPWERYFGTKRAAVTVTPSTDDQDESESRELIRK